MNKEEQGSSIDPSASSQLSRRGFIQGLTGAGSFLGMAGLGASCWQGSSRTDAPRDAQGNIIPGFEKDQQATSAAQGWQPVSDRKIKVGIAGFGLCQFGAAFFYQNHPNVDVVAATDLDPNRSLRQAGPRAWGPRRPTLPVRR